MKTSEFLSILAQNPGMPLHFEYQVGKFTRPDYHITEIKNVTYDTVDCGGAQNNWTEAIVQLWEDEMPDLNHSVNTNKALNIFEVVEKARATFKDVELKFEYGNTSFHTAVMGISAVEVTDRVVVKLFAENTTCKAKDRASSKEDKDAACCTPGGGCC
jgi:hypothetical protein